MGQPIGSILRLCRIGYSNTAPIYSLTSPLVRVKVALFSSRFFQLENKLYEQPTIMCYYLQATAFQEILQLVTVSCDCNVLQLRIQPSKNREFHREIYIVEYFLQTFGQKQIFQGYKQPELISEASSAFILETFRIQSDFSR